MLFRSVMRSIFVRVATTNFSVPSVLCVAAQYLGKALIVKDANVVRIRKTCNFREMVNFRQRAGNNDRCNSSTRLLSGHGFDQEVVAHGIHFASQIAVTLTCLVPASPA